MSKTVKVTKQHFELSPANRRRMDIYLERYNEDPSRVTSKLKIGDIVNQAVNDWLARHGGLDETRKDEKDAKKNKQE
jgi:hypothetical protein